MKTLEPRPMPGGPLAVDLLNTRWHIFDWLDDDAAVQEFSASYGTTVSARDVAATRSALIDARDLIQRLLQDGADVPIEDVVIDDSVIAETNAFLAKAASSLILSPDGPRLSTSHAAATNAVAIEAVVSAIELLGDRPDRLRSCEHDECTLWFVDTSKAGRRRWCTMERCGNRAKAQRHYKRSKDQELEAAQT